MRWKAIHVAGTNGKGSICAYTSAMLQEHGIKCGRYTSPHLITPRDCINISGQTVRKSLFDHTFEKVMQRNRELEVRASEFELLTATAFEIFNEEEVEIGVVEVGLGGRLDATNVLSDVLVSVISKIGLDHQSILGSTIAEIAQEKAGIMRQSVPCVVDVTNIHEALDALCRQATKIDTRLIFVQATQTFDALPLLGRMVARLDLQPHQNANLCCAVEAFKKAMNALQHKVDWTKVSESIESVQWPGRLQLVQISFPNVALKEVLLDGAHNPQSAEVLGRYVDTKLRSSGGHVTWLIALSDGKEPYEILSKILRAGDNVVAVQFGPVEGMPWVTPCNSKVILDAAERAAQPRATDIAGDVAEGLKCAAKLSSSDSASNATPVIVAGSLYLVSDFLRLQNPKDDILRTYQIC